MKVLFVNENIGGHSTTHLHLRRALEHRPEIRPEFFDVEPAGIGRRILGAAVPVLGRLDLDLQPLRSQLAHSAWTRRHLAERARGVDLIHVYTHNAVLLSTRLLAGYPTVVALDGTNSMNAHSLPYRSSTRFTPTSIRASRPLERRVYQAADVIVANSDRAARSLREDYQVSEGRIRTISYGVSAPFFDEKAAPGTRSARPVIAFAGRTLARKGGRQLLRVHQEHLRDRCDVLLITPEPVAAAPGVTVVSDLDTGDARLWSLLRSAAAFVFPSYIDQQPNVVMEAMAAGLPVVAHPINGMRDMVAHDHTGLHLEDRTDGALVSAIERLLDHPELRPRWGAEGRTRFDERFSADVSVDRLIAAFHDAVRCHRATVR